MNRKQFLKSLGLFMILPGAGRIWRARRYMRFYAVEELAPLPPMREWLLPIIYANGSAPYESLLTETIWLPNQGLVTRPRENPHLISQIQSDRQGEQQHTVLGRAVDPLHPPNDRPVS